MTESETAEYVEHLKKTLTEYMVENSRLKAREEALEGEADGLRAAYNFVRRNPTLLAPAPTEEPAGRLEQPVGISGQSVSTPQGAGAAVVPTLPADVAALVEEAHLYEDIDYLRSQNFGPAHNLIKRLAAALSARRVGVSVEDRDLVEEARLQREWLIGAQFPDKATNNLIPLLERLADRLALGQPEITVQQEDEEWRKDWRSGKDPDDDDEVQQALDTLRAHCKDMKGYWTDHIGLLDAEYPEEK